MVVIGDLHSDIVATDEVLPHGRVVVVSIAGIHVAAVAMHETVLYVGRINRRKVRIGTFGLQSAFSERNIVGQGDGHIFEDIAPRLHAVDALGILLVHTRYDVILIDVKEVLAVKPLARRADLIGVVLVVPDPNRRRPQVHLRIDCGVNGLVDTALAVVCHLHDVTFECVSVGLQQPIARVGGISKEEDALPVDPCSHDQARVVEVGVPILNVPGLQYLDAHAVDVEFKTFFDCFSIDDGTVYGIIVIHAFLYFGTDSLSVSIQARS